MLFIADPYRSEEEVNEWMQQRDPVKNFPQFLIENGVIGAEQSQQIIDGEVR
ncbi:MAG: hypothetical protein IPG20_06870 [Gammaproteobacteria bacterium]|nr:hypothetical protein [Gammaproteobacteria bacterium]